MNEPLLEVNVTCANGQNDMPSDLVARILDYAYRARRKRPATLDLLITSDTEMAKLNARHLGKNNPTDVLAFDDGEEEDGRFRLGDVAISAETARREAGERGAEFTHELVFYALHGLYHLLGMRDTEDADRAAMHVQQAKIMREFGLDVGDAFDGSEFGPAVRDR